MAEVGAAGRVSCGDQHGAREVAGARTPPGEPAHARGSQLIQHSRACGVTMEQLLCTRVLAQLLSVGFAKYLLQNKRNMATKLKYQMTRHWP